VNLNSKLREKIIPTYKMNETEEHIKDVINLMLTAAPRYTSIITDIVRQYMENDRYKFEQEIFKNRIELLKGIKKSFVNSK